MTRRGRGTGLPPVHYGYMYSTGLAKCAVSIGDGTLACFDPLQPPPSTLWTSDDAKGAPMRGCCSATDVAGRFQ